MKRIIERFYALIFEDKENPNSEPTPYANKAFMFYFSLIITMIVLFLIISDIIKNIQKMSVTGQ